MSGKQGCANKLRQQEHTFTTAIHPSAQIALSLDVGSGTVVMANIVINTDTKISRHVIFNTRATIDHNCIIEDYCHIAPGCFLCGQTKLGAGVLLGVGTNVCPAVKIGAQTISGVGSVVFKSLPSCCFAYGSPAKIIQTNYSQ